MFAMSHRRWRRAVIARGNSPGLRLAFLVVACVATSTLPLYAQRPGSDLVPQEDMDSTEPSLQTPIPDHGLVTTRDCLLSCVGETMDCIATAVFIDGFQDALLIKEAYDQVDTASGIVRVPAVGNLPIVAILGNAFCMDDGGPCDPLTGANCSLPCTIGPSEFTGSFLPGFVESGRVRFSQNQYVIQPGDTPNLADTIFFVWEDTCDSGDRGCPQTDLTTSATSNTGVSDCNDGNECTTDSCFEGECFNEFICLADLDCDDGSVCTTDTCSPEGCCEFTPLCATIADCDDGDECTIDTCSPDGCCQSEPLCTSAQDCDDGNVCTTNVCGGDGCCESIPDCTSAQDCDDGNDCTADACMAGGCCRHSQKICSDANPCTEDVCIRDVGCVFTKLDQPADGCVNVPAMSRWATIVLVLSLGVMMAIRFGGRTSERTS